MSLSSFPVFQSIKHLESSRRWTYSQALNSVLRRSTFWCFRCNFNPINRCRDVGSPTQIRSPSSHLNVYLRHLTSPKNPNLRHICDDYATNVTVFLSKLPLCSALAGKLKTLLLETFYLFPGKGSIKLAGSILYNKDLFKGPKEELMWFFPTTSKNL